MKENEALVSAILPVYNVDQYLRAAVQSLVNQTYTNIEIIIVNDGSTDKSQEVGEKLQSEFSNVTLVNQKNAGAAAARNHGMNKAQGKYFYFMDPDDEMQGDYIQQMVSVAEKAQAELVIAGFTNVYESAGRRETTVVRSEEHIYQTQTEFRKDAVRLLNNTQLAVPWNKLYLATYLVQNQITFPSVKWDDLHFNLEVIRNIQRVALADTCGYQFLRVRPGSETTTVFSDALFANRKLQYTHAQEVFSSWKLHDEIVDGQLAYYFISRTFQVIQEITRNNELSHKQKNEKIKAILTDLLVRSEAEKCQIANPLMKIVLHPVIIGSVSQSRNTGSLVSIAQNKFSRVFRSLRVKIMKVTQ